MWSFSHVLENVSIYERKLVNQPKWVYEVPYDDLGIKMCLHMRVSCVRILHGVQSHFGNDILVLKTRYSLFLDIDFEKVKNIDFSRNFPFSIISQKSEYLAFQSWNIVFKVAWDTRKGCHTTLTNTYFSTNLLKAKPHFDAQIVIRHPIESILVPRLTQKPSNRHFVA